MLLVIWEWRFCNVNAHFTFWGSSGKRFYVIMAHRLMTICKVFIKAWYGACIYFLKLWLGTADRTSKSMEHLLTASPGWLFKGNEMKTINIYTNVKLCKHDNGTFSYIDTYGEKHTFADAEEVWEHLTEGGEQWSDDVKSFIFSD